MEIGFLCSPTTASRSTESSTRWAAAGTCCASASCRSSTVFGIAFGVDVAWDETNQRHTLALEIQDPDGERLGDELTFEIEAGRPPGSVTGQDQRVVISLRRERELLRPPARTPS